jgi:hypothetical protein
MLSPALLTTAVIGNAEELSYYSIFHDIGEGKMLRPALLTTAVIGNAEELSYYSIFHDLGEGKMLSPALLTTAVIGNAALVAAGTNKLIKLSYVLDVFLTRKPVISENLI